MRWGRPSWKRHHLSEDPLAPSFNGRDTSPQQQKPGCGLGREAGDAPQTVWGEAEIPIHDWPTVSLPGTVLQCQYQSRIFISDRLYLLKGQILIATVRNSELQLTKYGTESLDVVHSKLRPLMFPSPRSVSFLDFPRAIPIHVGYIFQLRSQ